MDNKDKEAAFVLSLFEQICGNSNEDVEEALRLTSCLVSFVIHKAAPPGNAMIVYDVFNQHTRECLVNTEQFLRDKDLTEGSK